MTLSTQADSKDPSLFAEKDLVVRRDLELLKGYLKQIFDAKSIPEALDVFKSYLLAIQVSSPYLGFLKLESPINTGEFMEKQLKSFFESSSDTFNVHSNSSSKKEIEKPLKSYFFKNKYLLEPFLKSECKDQIVYSLFFSSQTEIPYCLYLVSDKNYTQKEDFIEIILSTACFKITELEKAHSIKNLAYQDELTGIGNSRLLQKVVEDEIIRSKRYGKGFSLAFVDIDDFKAINDNFGHREGDRVLASIAKFLGEHIREVDQVFRLGGDEFVILLLEADPKACVNAVARIKNQLANSCKNEVFSKRHMDITASFGMASYPIDGKTYNTLLESADRLMYAGKKNGKNQVCARNLLENNT